MTQTLSPAYYAADVGVFLDANPDTVLGSMTQNSAFAVELGQRDAWALQIEILTRIFHRGIEQRSGERVRRLDITPPNEYATHRCFDYRL